MPTFLFLTRRKWIPATHRSQSVLIQVRDRDSSMEGSPDWESFLIDEEERRVQDPVRLDGLVPDTNHEDESRCLLGEEAEVLCPHCDREKLHVLLPDEHLSYPLCVLAERLVVHHHRVGHMLLLLEVDHGLAPVNCSLQFYDLKIAHDKSLHQNPADE